MRYLDNSATTRLCDEAKNAMLCAMEEYANPSSLHKAGQAAQKMLVKTNARIGEIADECGFYDYNYFTKIFKRYTGLTPRDYRKKYNLVSGF